MTSRMFELLERTCLNFKCVYGCENIEEATLKDNGVDDLSEVLSSLKKLHDKKMREHLPCAIVYIQVMISRKMEFYRNKIEKQEDDVYSIQNNLIDIALVICKLPDIHYPLKLKHDSESDNEFDVNHKFNPRLTQECLRLYLSILTLQREEEDGQLLSGYHKSFLKRTCVPIMLLVSGRLGKFSWTNDKIRSQCESILNNIKKFTNHQSVVSLLSGSNSRQVLFREGILLGILDELSLVFKKDTWNKNLPWKHSFMWCVTKVKHPKLGQHIPKVIPFVLLMMDDYVDQNKLFGISTLLFILNNVNAYNLNLYNHGIVVFEVLFTQLFTTSNSIMYEALFPCLQKVLPMIEPIPGELVGIEWTKWDQTVEKIIQNVEMANHIETRRVLLKHLPIFIDDMKLNAGKHLESLFRLLQFVLQFPDTNEEETRINCLKVLRQIIKSCWILIPRYKEMLLKVHIKVFIDIKSSDALSKDTMKNIEEIIFDNLMLLRACCKEEFDDLLKDAVKTNITTCSGKVMQTILNRVLDIDISDYDFEYLSRS